MAQALVDLQLQLRSGKKVQLGSLQGHVSMEEGGERGDRRMRRRRGGEGRGGKGRREEERGGGVKRQND